MDGWDCVVCVRYLWWVMCGVVCGIGSIGYHGMGLQCMFWCCIVWYLGRCLWDCGGLIGMIGMIGMYRMLRGYCVVRYVGLCRLCISGCVMCGLGMGFLWL